MRGSGKYLPRTVAKGDSFGAAGVLHPAKLKFSSQIPALFQTGSTNFDAPARGKTRPLEIGIFSFSGRGIIFRRPHSVASLASHY
jgi:hypothetical protein